MVAHNEGKVYNMNGEEKVLSREAQLEEERKEFGLGMYQQKEQGVDMEEILEDKSLINVSDLESKHEIKFSMKCIKNVNKNQPDVYSKNDITALLQMLEMVNIEIFSFINEKTFVSIYEKVEAQYVKKCFMCSIKFTIEEIGVLTTYIKSLPSFTHKEKLKGLTVFHSKTKISILDQIGGV